MNIINFFPPKIVESFEVSTTKDQPLTTSNATTTNGEDGNNSPSDNSSHNENITMSSIDISEITRERDMLLEQVELLKEEHQFSLQVHQQAAAIESATPAVAAAVVSEAQASHRALLKEKDNLFHENERLLRELDILREAVVAQENQSPGNIFNFH